MRIENLLDLQIRTKAIDDFNDKWARGLGYSIEGSGFGGAIKDKLMQYSVELVKGGVVDLDFDIYSNKKNFKELTYEIIDELCYGFNIKKHKIATEAERYMTNYTALDDAVTEILYIVKDYYRLHNVNIDFSSCSGKQQMAGWGDVASLSIKLKIRLI